MTTGMNDEHGCSTCKVPGKENSERFFSNILKKWLVAYDYRDTDGELFSTTARDLETCRARRDAWIKEKRGEQ